MAKQKKILAQGAKMNQTPFFTISQLAKRFKVSKNHLKWALLRCQIQPKSRAGTVRLYANIQLTEIQGALSVVRTFRRMKNDTRVQEGAQEVSKSDASAEGGM
jgi:hypothetical protein